MKLTRGIKTTEFWLTAYSVVVWTPFVFVGVVWGIIKCPQAATQIAGLATVFTGAMHYVVIDYGKRRERLKKDAGINTSA